MPDQSATCLDCGIVYTGQQAQTLAEICEVADRRVRAQEFHEAQRDPS